MPKQKLPLKLLFDFGLVILIWMTQLIVYPSFSMMSETDLLNWHPQYTIMITIIVLPLMFGQVGIHAYSMLNERNTLKIISFVLIILAWANTFIYAVPLHNQIAAGIEVMESAEKLVTVNAYRTGFWTAVFGIDLYLHLKK